MEADAQHKKFLKNLDESQAAVWKVARWLNSKGYSVTVNVAPRAPSREVWKKYSDQGDLEVAMRVEVKHLGSYFTCADDYPFQDGMILCPCRVYDNSIPKPYAFIYLNKPMTYAAIVLGSSHQHWFVKNIKASQYEHVESDHYFVPLAHVEFVRLAGAKKKAST